MKPPAFDYHAPSTLDDALALLARLGEGAKILAGGQTLVPLLNMRLTHPEALVDLNRIGDLRGVTLERDSLHIGAMTTHMTLEHDPLVHEHVPLLAEVAGNIAHLQVRTRGTMGGSLVNAAPAAEWPAAVAALAGTMVARRADGGERTIAVDEFFTGPMTCALEADEILVGIRVPVPEPDVGSAFVEFARRHGDFALAGVAVLVKTDGNGRITRARIAICGMAEAGARLHGVESLLVGADADRVDLDQVERAVREAVDAPADHQLGSESRRHIAGTVARRALATAIGRGRAPAGR